MLPVASSQKMCAKGNSAKPCQDIWQERTSTSVPCTDCFNEAKLLDYYQYGVPNYLSFLQETSNGSFRILPCSRLVKGRRKRAPETPKLGLRPLIGCLLGLQDGYLLGCSGPLIMLLGVEYSKQAKQTKLLRLPAQQQRKVHCLIEGEKIRFQP